MSKTTLRPHPPNESLSGSLGGLPLQAGDDGGTNQALSLTARTALAQSRVLVRAMLAAQQRVDQALKRCQDCPELHGCGQHCALLEP